VVDDHELLRHFALRVLRRAGFDSLAASDGAEALDVLRSEHDIDLVLSDLHMPRMGGLELYRALGVAQRPPFLFASGQPSPELLALCRSDGVTLLEKPWTPSALIAACCGCLRRCGPDR